MEDEVTRLPGANIFQTEGMGGRGATCRGRKALGVLQKPQGGHGSWKAGLREAEQERSSEAPRSQITQGPVGQDKDLGNL